MIKKRMRASEVANEVGLNGSDLSAVKQVGSMLRDIVKAESSRTGGVNFYRVSEEDVRTIRDIVAGRRSAKKKQSSCGGCTFFDRNTSTCRSGAPSVGDDGRGVWPRVNFQDWCGAGDWEFSLPKDDF